MQQISIPYKNTIAIQLALFAVMVFVEGAAGQETAQPASQRYATPESGDVPDFQRHVVPLLSRLGCNSAKCHGSFQGQGEFRLSLFGFDFQADHAAIVAEAASSDGRRVDLQAPQRSLILRKPTLQVDHGGGQRLKVDSWERNLLRRWIAAGARGAKLSGGEQKPNNKPNSEETGGAFFKQSVQPILEDHCYECHGFEARKGGLSLSSRENLLAGGDSGPTLVSGKPELSRLIAAVRYAKGHKPHMPPSGKLAASKISVLEKWVRMGVPWAEIDELTPREPLQKLLKLEYEPREIVFSGADQTRQIRVVAHWKDGVSEDVTCLARFQTNNDAIVQVNATGLATAVGPGDTHIIVFYDNGVAAIPVLQPIATPAGQRTSLPVVGADSVDRFVNAKLNKMGLTPSPLCTDEEFLRRVSIDMTGTLPAPKEVISFLADRSQDKRARKIDELLERGSYAAWWANKLCDFTGCNPKSISSLLEVAREDGYVKASEWYDWVYQRVEKNEPYDELVAGIMLADPTGRGDGMPYFWTRQSLKAPKDTAMSVAHAFLGLQLQCAECHKHPFDQWTQSDFRQFAKFFDSITKTKRRSRASKKQDLQLLRQRVIPISPGDDPRQAVMDWMRDPRNPWFARAFVNRVWAGYFNVGIVEPPDQFTPANPPSNPQLLDWLTSGFVENGYDMKWLHRQIANSDAYQRSWKPNATNRNDRRNFSRSIPRRIPAEVVYDAMKQATAASDQLINVRTNLRRRASGHLSMRMAGTHAMKVFGKPDRSINCDCERVNEPTLLQAIFTQNDPLVRMRVADSGWIIEIEDVEAEGPKPDLRPLVDLVWLRTVGRRPNQQERRRALEHIATTSTAAEGVADLLWAMMNTKEFLLNH